MGCINFHEPNLHIQDRCLLMMLVGFLRRLKASVLLSLNGRDLQ